MVAYKARFSLRAAAGCTAQTCTLSRQLSTGYVQGKLCQHTACTTNRAISVAAAR